MARKYYKTIVQIEILSEDEPYSAQELSLTQINDDITTGPYSGTWDIVSDQLLSPREAAQELIKQDSEPGFFGLDENGNEVED